jgi:DNA-binding GntR family transcriptional regulator
LNEISLEDPIGLPDVAYEQLKERLMDGALAPGERLVIDRLAAELGVSQTPIREALARLEADRLVVKVLNRGYTSAPPLTGERLLQLYELRLILEPPAVELALLRADHGLPHRLAAAIERLERAPAGASYREYRQVAEADAAFHDAIARASGNEYLIEAMGRLTPHQQTARLYTLRGVPDIPEAAGEHRAILRAVEAGDPAAANEAMRGHLQQARSRLLTILDPRSALTTGAA